jgi:hypothetical protein
MRFTKFLRCTIAALLLGCLAGAAQAEGESLQSGWLELVKGSRDNTLGAELVEIEEGDSAGEQKVTFAIPKDSVANPDDIEEVLVIGQKPPEPQKSKPIKFTYEWVSDYDSDNYGLVIRLSKDTNWPIRLYMNSEAGFIQ